MNREILFRGKRIDNGEWIANNSMIYLKDRGTVYISAHKKGVMFEGDDNYIIGIANCMFLGVNPKTVGQYTGLTDKNGVKIFEGDICEVACETRPYQVEWDDCNLEFELSSLTESFGIGCRAGYELEVIGNIHDNPEFLEEN